MNENAVVMIPLDQLIAVIISAYRAGLLDHLDQDEEQEQQLQ